MAAQRDFILKTLDEVLRNIAKLMNGVDVLAKAGISLSPNWILGMLEFKIFVFFNIHLVNYP